MKYLLMKISAPMQTWRYDNYSSKRKTVHFPTKSGIVGMICSAMDCDLSNVEQVADISKLRMTSYNVSYHTSYTDFQVTGNGYKRKIEDYFQIQKKDVSKNKYTHRLSNREYLIGAEFYVTMQGDDVIVDKIAQALKQPKNILFFGSRNCIPSEPIFRGIYSNEEEIKQIIGEVVQTVEECSIQDSNYRIKDYPIDFSKKQYMTRFLKIS